MSKMSKIGSVIAICNWLHQKILGIDRWAEWWASKYVLW